jgi:protoporphyrinogen/coproporphyrinogen III oxidase
MPRTIVVIGGGIAGLTAAHTLQKESDLDIILLEARRLGGKIRTTREGPFLVEHGPDSIFTAKPAALELLAELSLEHEIIEPKGREFSILSKRRLHPVPRPLVSLLSVDNSTLEKVGFLSRTAKLRALREPDVPKGPGRDETIASFFRRRFGNRFSMALAEPMLAGIHAGDPERLSMAALYPSYLGLEQKYGRLAMPEAPELQGSYFSGRRPGFISLRSGLETLPTALAQALDRVDLRAGVRVELIEWQAGRLRIDCGQEHILADAAILALPAYASSTLMREIAPSPSEKLKRIRYVSTAVATLAYDRTALEQELRGNGFLVPTDEPCAITGCTWSSNKWEGRAPEDRVLMRAFMGRDGSFEVMTLSDDALLERAEKELAPVLGGRQAPGFRMLHRWPHAMPQCELGHNELMEEIESELSPLPIRLAGSGYRGSGIPDCIRQGREAAQAILALQRVMI